MNHRGGCWGTANGDVRNTSTTSTNNNSSTSQWSSGSVLHICIFMTFNRM